jgi:hypothetical protein
MRRAAWGVNASAWSHSHTNLVVARRVFESFRDEGVAGTLLVTDPRLRVFHHASCAVLAVRQPAGGPGRRSRGMPRRERSDAYDVLVDAVEQRHWAM